MSIPSSNKYPEFVPDQLLTSEHLNNLFAYTDSEGRATRSRLIGIGVVCGLEVRMSGASITITKGCGVTSAGYLVRLEEDTTYTHSRKYDPLTEHAYDRFLNAAGNGPAFDLHELKQAAVTEDTSPLTAADLKDKVVVMFVELLAEGAKNCDPTSCDDKGTTVTVSFLPMLVDGAAAQALMGNEASGFSTSAAATLPLLRMPRYDVPATSLVNAAGVLNGFRKLLTPAFLKNMEAALAKAYDVFKPLVSDLYADNPFSSLASDFAEQYDDLDTATMLALQYHYDLFSDLMLAHDELRQVGEKLLAVCCPDEDLFPRHLVLGAVAGGGPRHDFQPSAALAGEGRQVTSLRLLFRRLVLLVQRFSVPAPKQSGRKSKALPIRITPSQWGTEPLSERAIPFYYKVENPAPALFQHWSAERARTGRSNLTLSYHSAEYSTNNPTVTEPLNYDLEPFDFLRIEGHIGQKMPTALGNILQQKAEKRLPFEVVALGADLRNVTRLIRSLIAQQRATVDQLTNATTGVRANNNLTNNFSTLNRAASATLQSTAGRTGLLGDCHVQDLEAIYDTLRAEMECVLCCEMQYFYGIAPRRQQENSFNAAGTTVGTNTSNATAQQQELIPAVPLLKSCAPEFRYKAGTLGQMFELYWPSLASKPYNSPDQGLEQIEALIAALEAQGNRTFNKDALGLWLALLLLYYIEKLWEILPTSLSLLDAEAFATRYEDLMQVARAIKELINDDLTGERNNDNPDVADLFTTEDVIDHLDALIYACKDSAFEAVYREFLLRYMRALLRQKFGFFANQHPGIQHKAGVPMGGTFILVYHEAEIELEDEEEEAQNVFSTAQARREAFTAFFQNKKAQATGAAKEAREAKTDAAGVPVTEKLGVPEVVSLSLVKQTVTYSKMLTEGDAKAMAFFEKYAATLRKDEDEDTTLQDLLDELPDGTVIADFCLPYLCCSDCPPMQFVVHGSSDEEEPEPENPSLNIEQKDYCNDDKSEYPIVVTPEGGELKGEGVNSSQKTFNPTTVALPAGASSKEVTISYTTEGGTDSKTLTVFARPDASFKPQVSPASPLDFSFTDTSTHAQSWEWDFGDGETSTEQSPLHSYKQRGEHSVRLIVRNGPCSDEAKEVIVVGIQTEEPQRASCAPLADIIADFQSFDRSLGRTGAKFIEAFKSYGDVVALFMQQLPEVSKGDEKDQAKNFAENSTATKLADWMGQLQSGLILEGVNRTQALALYRLLLRLLLYIVCVQGNDLDKAPELAAALKQVREHVRAWSDAKFSATDQKIVDSIGNDVDAELTRAKARGGKPDYEKTLSAILKDLKA